MERAIDQHETNPAAAYGGTVLELAAVSIEDMEAFSMSGPPTTKGTSISTTPATGPDKNGQYKTDSDNDSNVDVD